MLELIIVTAALFERLPNWTAVHMEVHFCVKFSTKSSLQRKFKPNCMLSAFNVDISVDAQNVAGDGETQGTLYFRYDKCV